MPIYESISLRINDLKNTFKTLVEKLLTDLSWQNDVDMRFLGVRLNFNEYYAVSRRRGNREKRQSNVIEK